MLKIWSLKQQQDKEDGASESGPDGGGQPNDGNSGSKKKKKKVTAAQLRVQKDLTELSLPPNMKTSFPDPDDIMNFVLILKPDDGMYKGGTFKFSFAINPNFPHEPPKVKCLQKVYHPNIDLEGNVCLNILREDWKPVLNINAVMVGLQYLFLEPNASDPLNKDAANELHRDRVSFKRSVRDSMNGYFVGGELFDNVMQS